MRLLLKKIYCNACYRLVRSREQKNNSNIEVLCCVCGKIIRVWDGIRWKSIK